MIFLEALGGFCLGNLRRRQFRQRRKNQLSFGHVVTEILVL